MKEVWQATVISHSAQHDGVVVRLVDAEGRTLSGALSIELPATSYEHARAIAAAFNCPRLSNQIYDAYKLL